MTPEAQLLTWAVLVFPLAAHAECGPVAPLARPPLAAQMRADGLAAAINAGTLSIWPEAARLDLNQDYSVEVLFADRPSCLIRLPAASQRGVTIQIGKGQVVAVEAAICEKEEGMCLPVHLAPRQGWSGGG